MLNLEITVHNSQGTTETKQVNSMFYQEDGTSLIAETIRGFCLRSNRAFDTSVSQFELVTFIRTMFKGMTLNPDHHLIGDFRVEAYTLYDSFSGFRIPNRILQDNVSTAIDLQIPVDYSDSQEYLPPSQFITVQDMILNVFRVGNRNPIPLRDTNDVLLLSDIRDRNVTDENGLGRLINDFQLPLATIVPQYFRNVTKEFNEIETINQIVRSLTVNKQ